MSRTASTAVTILSRTERPDKDSAGIRIDAPPKANPGGPL
jgi:hypothetical protein